MGRNKYLGYLTPAPAQRVDVVTEVPAVTTSSEAEVQPLMMPSISVMVATKPVLVGAGVLVKGIVVMVAFAEIVRRTPIGEELPLSNILNIE